MIKWHHILEQQPASEEEIIQCDPSYMGHHCIAMRTYQKEEDFEGFLKWCEEYDFPKPNFWWTPAKDFPFPIEGKT